MSENTKLATFEITNLERLLPENIVWRIYYTATLTENEKSASCSGFVGLFYKDPSDEGFVPFEQVTQKQVYQWMMDRLNEGDIYRISRQLNEELNGEDVPKIKTGLPCVLEN